MNQELRLHDLKKEVQDTREQLARLQKKLQYGLKYGLYDTTPKLHEATIAVSEAIKKAVTAREKYQNLKRFPLMG